MISYFLESTICWFVFYGFYLLVLERETFFTLNRFYLLITFVLGLLFPIIEIGDWQILNNHDTVSVMLQPVTVIASQMGYTLQEIVVTPVAKKTNYLGQFLLSIYLIGVVLTTSRLIHGWWSIHRLKSQSIVIQKTGYTLVKTDQQHLPFSFFRNLFWSKNLKLSLDDETRILKHELTHIRQHHSIDILLLEMFSILFWFNPVLWFYKKSIRNTHEYLADKQVIAQHQKKQYGQLLLRQMQSGPAFSLTHNFNHSQLKKRFQMMNKNKSSRWAMTRYIWALPIFAVLLLAFKASDMLPKNSQNPILPVQQFHVNQSPGDSIFTEVEQMPMFPGCEDIADIEERRNCSNTKMLEYVYTKIKYPELARKNNNQGLVVVRFIINKKGLLESPEIMKSLGDGMDEEVLRVVENMPPWTPGIQNGKKVNVYFNLPIKFKLADEEPPVEKTTRPIVVIKDPSASINDEVLTKVDQMPMFPGCDEITDVAERKSCADQKMLQHIYTNIKYPELARKTGSQGTVVVRFIVDKNGNIVKPEVVRSVGFGCDTEVLRVVGTLPNWNPGIHEGEKVDVYFNLPVKFKLQSNEPPVVKTEKEVPDTPIKLSIFPNPTSGQIKIGLKAVDQPTTLYISDIRGKILKEETFPAVTEVTEINFDLSTLGVTGTLFVTIQQGTQVKTEQVIVN